jgi:uncharacterized protein
MLKKLRYIVLIYFLICSLYYAYQHLLYFQPKALAANHILTFPVRVRFTSVKMPFDENTVIDVVKFKSADSLQKPKGVVFFFHGNRFNVEHYSTYAPYFTKHGYEVWMPDYPGYGRSSGEMEMGILNQLATQVYTMARTQYAPNEIVVYGKSLGTGIASYLASVRDCRHLLLETPYYSLSSLTQSYLYFIPIPLLIRYNLKTGEYFKDITAPITVMHGTRDELIPFGNVQRLLPMMKKTDAFYAVEGGKHNTLPDYDAYFRVVDSVMRR